MSLLDPVRLGPREARDRLVFGPWQRTLALTGALSEWTPPRVVEAPPERAADGLLTYPRGRGCLG